MLKKLGVAIIFGVLHSASVLAASNNIKGAAGVLANIDNMINVAVEKAQMLYEENGGSVMNSSVSLLVSQNYNPYLRILRVTPDYKVEIQLQQSANTNFLNNGYNYQSPVSKVLLGAQIVLYPVYDNGNIKITGFECLTNADKNMKEFIGQAIEEMKASNLREYSNNARLSICVYVNQDNLFQE